MSIGVKELEKIKTNKSKKDKFLLDSLEIKGYRCFEHLTIEKLGRVNLIVGKNNVGKTALLEALWIWCEGSAWNYVLRTIDKILTRRSEKSPKQLHEDGREYRHLFYNRPQKDFYQFSISNNRPIPRVVEEWEEIESTLNKEKNPIAEEMVGVELQISNKSAQIISNNLGERNHRLFHKDINNLFVDTRGLDASFVTEVWDEIIYKIKEDEVKKALQVILPELVDVNFNSYPKGAQNRVPVVRVKGIGERVPLKSLGEGMNRLLEIALALIECENGVLLVDEIENGLHYSVLLDVWRLIFKTARDLNVQVFATTHSSDCVNAFQRAAEEDKEDEGMLIRLVRKRDKIKAVLFDEKELETVVENDIEVR